MVGAMLKGAAAGAVAAGLAGCSLLLDWNDYSGGAATGSCPADSTCAPAFPVDWAPVALYEWPVDAAVPACADGYVSAPAFQGHGGFDADAGATTCSACSCSPGGACSSPGRSFFADSECTTACGTSQPLASTCVTAPSCNYFQVGESTPTGAACTASGGTASLHSPWSETVSACTPSGAPACGSGGVCLPAPSASQNAGFCISQAGVAPCPAGPYSVKHVFYDGLTDTRGCDPCTCTVTSSPECMGGDGLPYTMPSCEVPIPSSIPFLVPSGCVATSFSSAVIPAGGFKLVNMPTLQPATCAASPSGGQPTGSVTPNQP